MCLGGGVATVLKFIPGVKFPKYAPVNTTETLIKVVSFSNGVPCVCGMYGVGS